MTKKDLKVGMVVETESNHGKGLAMITVAELDGLVLSGTADWFPLSCLNDDLIYGECKITKVYSLSRYADDAHKLSTDSRKLLWERPTYYNGKVVCVDDNDGFAPFTVGKIYEFKDGYTKDDCAIRRPMGTFAVKTLAEFQGNVTNAKFIEVVE